LHHHIHHWILLISSWLTGSVGLLQQAHLHHLLVVLLKSLLLHDDHLLVVNVLLLHGH